MKTTFDFSIYLPLCSVFGTSETPASLTLYAYESGFFLSAFSGSYIINYDDETIEDVGISESFAEIENSFCLQISSNIVYDTIAYYYFNPIPLGYYSGSVTLGYMSPQTMGDLSVARIV